LAPVRAVPGKTAEERLKYMVGQLVLTGFSGRQPDEPDVERIIHDIRDGKVSGVIVRDSNVAGSQQLRRLLSAVANAGGEAPPLLAIDQPGGPDTVLSEEKGFAFYSSASSVSSGGNAYEAQLLYRAMAGELASLGVNFNIGPSEDACREDGVNLSAFCFGATPSRIAAFARAFNFGHHDRGVLTALRHVPFRSGLRSSWVHERASSAILHLLVKAETSDALVVRVKAMEPMPLTDVALAWRQKKARAPGGRSSGFDGALIFELDMGPGGAPLRYDEVVLRAFQAGADMILVREPTSVPAGLYNVSLDSLRTAIKSNRLPMARIAEAYKRVQRLKARLRASPSRTKVAGLDR
jgi:beta-glucosidase-like glycosyl hydrolase